MSRRAKFSKKIKYAFYGGVFLCLVGGIIGGNVLIYWVRNLEIPDLQAFDQRRVAQSTKIYDRTGNTLLWDIHQDIKRTVVPFEDISRHLKNATVAIEDSSFYQHRGIDFKAVARAVFVNIKTMNFTQGFSTITQQLIKNTLLTGEKSLSRKLKEVILTLKIEKVLTKEEILNLYLNEIPYGGSDYGAEAASQDFFGKKAKDLTLAESAYLAAIPQAPSYYSPYGAHLNALETRKNTVLKRMAELNFITRQEEELAKTEKVKFASGGGGSIKAPHFSIIIRNYLDEKYGKDTVEAGGLKVITTLNYELQQTAERLVAQYAAENMVKFDAYNAGLTAIDPKTGQVLVMVGSKGWSEESLPAGCTPGLDCKFEPKPNVAIYGIGRQPGSSIKPFVYATAFKKGYTPDTVLFDLPTEFNASCNPDGTPQPGVKPEDCYMPVNYDSKYRGPITLRNALAQSINVPAVKTLYLSGIVDSMKTMKDMGISSINDPNRYGLTLVLGGGEVSLFEMVSAYGVFANQGVRNKPVYVLKVEDSKGKKLEEFSPQPAQVLDKNISLLVTDILSDNIARTPAYGENSLLNIPGYQVAVKTGTTNNYRDVWVIGYTPTIAAGVWAGNNDSSPMQKKVAGVIATPLWNAFFTEAVKVVPKEDFEKPVKQQTNKPVLSGIWRGGQAYFIDSASGKLANEFTPPETKKEEVITEVHSVLYWLDKNNPSGPRPVNPQSDSQFILWETPIRAWAQTQGIKDQTIADVPTAQDDVHRPDLAPKIQITSPTPDVVYNPSQRLNVRIAYQSSFGLSQVDYFLDNTYIGSSKKIPFDFSFIPQNISSQNAEASSTTISTSELKISAYDKVKNKTEVKIPVKFSQN